MKWSAGDWHILSPSDNTDYSGLSRSRNPLMLGQGLAGTEAMNALIESGE